MAEITTKPAINSFNRILAWWLPAIAALTPFVIVYALVRPNVGQAFFFQFATLATTAGLGAAMMLGWRALPGRPTFPLALLLLNAVALICSLAVSPDWSFSLKQALLPICGFVFFYLIISHPQRLMVLERLRVVLVGLGGMLALYGILQHFGYEFIRYSSQVEKNRVIATIGHPNYLASVLGPVLFITLGLVISSRGWGRKIIGAALAGLLLFCIALAQTRGVWLGMALGAVAMALVGARYCLRHGVGLRWLAGLTVGAMLFFAGLGVVIFKVLPTYGRGINLEQRLVASKEIKSRLYYWHTAIDMAAQSPRTVLFGQGYAMFDPLFWDYALAQQKAPLGPFYYDVLPAVEGRSPGHVHNEYLEVLAEEGWVGLGALMLLLGFFLFFGYWSVMADPRPDRALQGAAVWGAFVTILVDALFAFPWRLPVSLIVFAAVLAFLYDMIYPREEA